MIFVDFLHLAIQCSLQVLVWYLGIKALLRYTRHHSINLQRLLVTIQSIYNSVWHPVFCINIRVCKYPHSKPTQSTMSQTKAYIRWSIVFKQWNEFTYTRMFENENLKGLKQHHSQLIYCNLVTTHTFWHSNYKTWTRCKINLLMKTGQKPIYNSVNTGQPKSVLS